MHLQEVGREYGVTTGRRRRCGWLDLVVMKYSCLINGYDSLNLTKLDILDDFEEIKVGVKYLVNEQELPSFPGRKVQATTVCGLLIICFQPTWMFSHRSKWSMLCYLGGRLRFLRRGRLGSCQRIARSMCCLSKSFWECRYGGLGSAPGGRAW